MFGLGGLQLKIIAAVFVLGLISSGYLYIKFLRSEIQNARQQQETMQESIDAYQNQMESYIEDMQNMQRINQNLIEDFDRSRQEVNNLADRFTQNNSGEQRDLNGDSLSRPQLIENLVNRGTNYALRCNEIVTGSPISELDDQNNICPDLIEKLRNKQ